MKISLRYPVYLIIRVLGNYLKESIIDRILLVNPTSNLIDAGDVKAKSDGILGRNASFQLSHASACI
jgi:hypothetical protein